MTSLDVTSRHRSQKATGSSRDVIFLSTDAVVGVDVAIAVDDRRCVQGTSSNNTRAATTTKTLQCSVEGCGRIFTSSAHLKVHQRIHTGEKPFSCSYCSKSFSTSYGVKTHERTHTNDQPYQCMSCKKAFKTSGDLLKHSRTHTGEKPFKCLYDGCGKYFRTSNALKVHERQHTGERPYECKVSGCGLRFSNPANYRAHERVHTGEKPYQCSHTGCSRMFTEYSSWYKHQVVHSDCRPYRCDKCGKMYRQVSTLASHKRNCHSTELPHHIQLTLSQTSSNSKPHTQLPDRVEVMGTADIPIDDSDIPGMSDGEETEDTAASSIASKRHIDVAAMTFPLSSLSDVHGVHFSGLYPSEVSASSVSWCQRTQECAVCQSSQASIAPCMFVQSSPTGAGFPSISAVPTASSLDYTIQSLMPTPQIASVSGNSIFSQAGDETTPYHQSFVHAGDVTGDVIGFPVHSFSRELSQSLDTTAQLQVDAIVQQLSGSQSLNAHQLLASASESDLALAMRNGALGLCVGVDSSGQALLTSSEEATEDLPCLHSTLSGSLTVGRKDSN